MTSTKKEEEMLVGLQRVLSDMPEAIQDHPSHDVLAAFQSGMLEGEDSTAIEKHLSSCQSCREKVELLEDLDRDMPEEFVNDRRTRQGLVEKAMKAVRRIVDFSLGAPVAVQAMAAAADSTTAVPDEEVRLDQAGDGPFEAYLQRVGDRLVVAFYAGAGSDLKLHAVRDADTGDPLCTTPEGHGEGEWVFDLGSAKALEGRTILSSVTVDQVTYRLEARIGP